MFALAPAVSAPARAASPTLQAVETPHSEARLIADISEIRPGEPFTAGIHIKLDRDWHTYWKNAGDAGNGIILGWRLPAGFEAGPVQWPVPERIPYPPLLNYGYHDEVVFPVRITPAADLEGGRDVRLAVRADFLVCADVCLPATANLELRLPVAAGGAVGGEAQASREARLIRKYQDQLPVEPAGWTTRAAEIDGGFVLAVRPPEGWDGSLRGAYFFPEHTTALSHTADQPAGTRDGEVRLRLTKGEYLSEELSSLEGILVLPEGASFDDAGHRSLAVSAPLVRGEEAAWAAEPTTPLPQVAAGAGGGGGMTLAVALLFAFLGGLILNLMPCVFPILSLKALGFATHAGDRSTLRAQGLAFGAGVVLTFLAVAGVLMAVRATGAEIGWGYQLQNPVIVALLAALMFGIGLVLAGTVEVGTSLTRLGGLGDGGGYGGSFLTGVLATVVATPCTAPFMGAAIGTALVRPPIEGLTVFAGLGIGMATPYVGLSFWPALARRLPKPGRWMESFKQFLAFPMFAVAIWLLWVFGLQVGVGGAARLLFALLLLAMAAWLIGRWPAITVSPRTRLVTRALATLAILAAVFAGIEATRGQAPGPVGGPAGAAADGSAGAGGIVEGAIDWGTFSQERVDELRAAGNVVFVDFTAAWCISCQVNERVALETRQVARAFEENGVVALKADWTSRDPAITRALASFDRSGVPLYVVYPADLSAEPRLLPTLLTPKIVIDAVREAGGSARFTQVSDTR